jgi:hypothetical protein
MFPAHLLYLLFVKQYTARALISGLSHAITRHLTPTRPSAPFPLARFAVLIAAATAGITAPALLWFASVSLAS